MTKRTQMFIQAEKLYREKKYEMSRDLYLQLGKTFNAAKSEASRGINYIPSAIQIIEKGTPKTKERVIRNLARFFYDAGDFKIVIGLLKQSGLHEEAEAIAIATGTHVSTEKYPVVEETQKQEKPPITAPEIQKQEKPLIAAPEIQKQEKPLIAAPEMQRQEKPPITAPEIQRQVFPVTQPLQRKEQEQINRRESEKDEKGIQIETKGTVYTFRGGRRRLFCGVCKHEIKEGDSYVFCSHCDGPNHEAHLIEWIRINRACPVCKKELKMNDYKR